MILSWQSLFCQVGDDGMLCSFHEFQPSVVFLPTEPSALDGIYGRQKQTHCTDVNAIAECIPQPSDMADNPVNAQYFGGEANGNGS